MEKSTNSINKALLAHATSTRIKAKRPGLHINTHCVPCRPVSLRLSPRRSVSPAALMEITTTGGMPSRMGSCDQCDCASEILPWLYLGSARDAADVEKLSEKNIRYILNATKEVEGSPEVRSKGFEYLKLDLADTSDQPIAPYFEQTIKFIEDAHQRGVAVLVHCRRGISRSATLVIAYVMQHLETSFEHAFEFVKQKRAIINPNLGFVLALESISPTTAAAKKEQQKHQALKRKLSTPTLAAAIAASASSSGSQSPRLLCIPVCCPTTANTGCASSASSPFSSPRLLTTTTTACSAPTPIAHHHLRMTSPATAPATTFSATSRSSIFGSGDSSVDSVVGIDFGGGFDGSLPLLLVEATA